MDSTARSASPPFAAAGSAAVETAAQEPWSHHENSTTRVMVQPRHGRVERDVWTKSVRGSVHMLKVPRGWALDVADLDGAEALGAWLVHLHDLEQLVNHWATIATIRARGFAFDRGHGRQVGLGLEHWRPTRQDAEAPNAVKTADGPLAVQLDMFGRVVA